MVFSQADIEVLRLCAWCKDLPAPLCRNIPQDILEWLELLALIRKAESGPSYRMTPKGISFLEQIGFCVSADGQYRSGDILKRRLQTAEICSFFWRFGVDVFCEMPRTEKGTETFLPSFSMRRKENTNILGGSRLCGFYYTDHAVFVPYYITPNNEGVYPAVEQRTFRAESLSLGKMPHVIYTGCGTLEELLALVRAEKVRKEKCTTDSFWEAIPKYGCPVAVVPMDENGMRQLRILRVPDYKERLLRSLLGKSYLPPVLSQSDGRSKENKTTCIVGFDCNISRFESIIQQCKGEPHIIVLSTQFHAIEPLFFGRNVAVSAVDIGDVERLLGIPSELPLLSPMPFLTEKGEPIYVPPIRQTEKTRRKGRQPRTKT